MRYLLLFGLLFFQGIGGGAGFGGGAGMGGGMSSPPAGIAHVQSCANYVGSGGIASVDCTFGSNVTAGDFVYACVSGIDSVTATWTGIGGTVVADPPMANVYWNTSIYSSCAYLENVTGGSAVLTASFSPSNGYTSINGEEFSGVATTSALDQSDTPSAFGPTTTPTSNSVTTTQNGEAVLGYVCSGASTTITAGSGYTAGGLSGFPCLLEWQIQSTAGSIDATATLGASNFWIAHVATFKHP